MTRALVDVLPTPSARRCGMDVPTRGRLPDTPLPDVLDDAGGGVMGALRHLPDHVAELARVREELAIAHAAEHGLMERLQALRDQRDGLHSQLAEALLALGARLDDYTAENGTICICSARLDVGDVTFSAQYDAPARDG